MAEFVFDEYARAYGIADRVSIDSAATSREEIGNDVYPPVRKTLEAHGVPCGHHSARQITRADYDASDLIIVMDASNERDMRRVIGGDTDGKIRYMLDFTDRPGDIADPWYTRDFETCYRDIDEGCRGLAEALKAGLPREDSPKEKPKLKDAGIPTRTWIPKEGWVPEGEENTAGKYAYREREWRPERKK